MVICFGAVTLGVLGSIIVHSGFQPRYSAPMFVLLPLLAGIGVLALPDRLRLPTLAAVAALGLVGASSTLTSHHKTRPARLPRRCAPRRHLVTSSSTARTSWPRRAAGWCSRTPAGALLRRQRPVAGGLGGLRRPGDAVRPGHLPAHRAGRHGGPGDLAGVRRGLRHRWLGLRHHGDGVGGESVEAGGGGSRARVLDQVRAGALSTDPDGGPGARVSTGSRRT